MRNLSCAAVALLLVVAPAGRSADEKPPQTPYFPLKVGDTWNYRMGDSKYTVKVAKYEKVDDQNCARMEMIVGGKVQSFDLVAVKPDGVYRYMSEGVKATPPVLFFKLPPKKDETWKVDSTAADQGKLTGTFKSGEVDELTVAGKKYEKVVTVTGNDLDANGQAVRVAYYFAKDVGMVRQTLNVGGKDIVIDLEKFEAGK